MLRWRTLVSRRSTASLNSCLSFSLFSSFCLSSSSSACVDQLHTTFTAQPVSMHYTVHFTTSQTHRPAYQTKLKGL